MAHSGQAETLAGDTKSAVYGGGREAKSNRAPASGRAVSLLWDHGGVTSQQTPLTDRTPDELAGLPDRAAAGLRRPSRAAALKLDLTRGKPSSAQLDLSDGLLVAAQGRA